MKKAIFGALALLALAAPVYAELKVAVFDSAAVMAGNNAAKRAASAMESRVSAAQARINQLEKPLLDKQKQLREQAAVMAPDKARVAQTEFMKELAAFRQQAQSIQGGLEQENLKQRQRISEGVKAVVAQLAQEKGYDLVLPKGLVFHSGATVPDITADVLARANTMLDK